MTLAIYAKRVVCFFLSTGWMTDLKEVITSHQ